MTFAEVFVPSVLRARLLGRVLGLRTWYSLAVIENQMEENMEHEMEAGLIKRSYRDPRKNTNNGESNGEWKIKLNLW